MIPREPLPPRGAEALLIDALPSLASQRCLCLSSGRAQFALAAAQSWPTSEVECLYLDLYQAELARTAIGTLPTNLAIRCETDFSEQSVDLAALAFSAQGEADLVRDLLQSAYERLTLGGVLLAATDNPQDTWLHEQLAKLGGDYERTTSSQGTCYRGVKRHELKKRKEYSAEVVFRDGERLLRAVTRPGVFSHRRVDPGARRLLEQLANEEQFSAASRIVDIGCGWGTVAFAAAARAPAGRVLALDSSTRAVVCTRDNAALNQLPNITAQLSATGEINEPGSYDFVLANPPYYAHFRIAELFVTAGHRALRPGGVLIVVTKSGEWYLERLSDWYEQVERFDARGYTIVRAVKA